MTFRKKAFSGLRWTAGVRLASQLFTWVITLFVIRILSPADYGLLAMATVVIAFLSMLSEIGMGPAIVQKSVIAPDILNRIFGLVLVLNFAICVILSLVAPLIAEFYQEERLVRIIQVMSLQFLLNAFIVIPEAMLQRELEFRKRSLIDLSGAILGGLTTLGLAVLGMGVWSLIVGSFASQLWKVIGLNRIAHSIFRPAFSFSGLREYVAFGAHLSLIGLLWFFFTQADVLIAGRWLGKEALGHYAVAMHLASLFNQRIAGVVNQVAFPTFACIQHDLQKVGEKVLLGSRLLSFIAFPCLWGISAVAQEVVMLVLGPKWEPAIFPLSVLTLIMPLRVVGNFLPNALQGIGRTDVILKNTLLACAIMPTAYMLGVNWGLEGLAYAWLVGSPFLFVLNSVRSMSALGLHKTDLLKSLLPSALSSSCMYACVAIVRTLMGAQFSNLTTLLVLILVGIIAYICATIFMNRTGCQEFIGVLKEIVMPK